MQTALWGLLAACVHEYVHNKSISHEQHHQHRENSGTGVLLMTIKGRPWLPSCRVMTTAALLQLRQCVSLKDKGTLQWQ